MAKTRQTTADQRSGIGERIRLIRQKRGMNQPQLAERLGVTKNAITNWETGFSRPDLATIPRLCEVLSVSADTLLGIRREHLTEGERQHLAAWRSLTPSEQRSVDTLILSLAENRRAALRANSLRIRWSPDKVCAGAGNPLGDGGEAESLWLRRCPETEQADEVITVTGDSMEPTYHDGDDLLVAHAEELREGEIGVFVLNGEGTVKEYRADGLYPHNRERYPVIRPQPGDGLRLVGRVLGRVTDSLRLSEEEIREIS